MAEETPIEAPDLTTNPYPDFEAELEEEMGCDPSAHVVTEANQGKGVAVLREWVGQEQFGLETECVLIFLRESFSICSPVV